MFIWLSWLVNQLKYDKIKLKKSDKASKKGNDCNVSQVSLDVNPDSSTSNVHFWRFSAIFGYFRPHKVTIDPFDPFDPRFRGGHKRDKKSIWHRFLPFLEASRVLFWAFLAFFGNFWRFSTPKGHHRPFWPRVWGGHKSDKNRYLTRIKSWVFGQPGYDMGTANKSSGNGLKMILGVRRF